MLWSFKDVANVAEALGCCKCCRDFRVLQMLQNFSVRLWSANSKEIKI